MHCCLVFVPVATISHEYVGCTGIIPRNTETSIVLAQRPLAKHVFLHLSFGLALSTSLY